MPPAAAVAIARHNALGKRAVRKVRAAQGTTPANGRAGQPDGQCNREQTA